MKRIICLCLFLLVGIACKETTKPKVETQRVAFTKEGDLKVYKTGTDSLLASLDIEIADNEYETQTGLMYRDSLAQDHGMLFIFPTEEMHSFYMKNTNIPLDILFIRTDQTIATIAENTSPMDESSISSGVPVRYVLEVNAGYVKRHGISAGDSIVFRKNRP